MFFKVKWFLTLIIALTFLTHCKTAKKKTETMENPVAEVAEVVETVKEDPIPAGHLPSLSVNGDSCFAYLKPDRKDTAFGPLKKGEGLKRLDANQGWVRVWISRLRLAGWVHKEEVSPFENAEIDQGTIPVEFLPTAEVTKAQVDILEEPSAGSGVVYQATSKEVFHILGEKDGWYQFWIPQLEKSGWTFGKLEGLPEKELAPEPPKVVGQEEDLVPSNLFQTYAVVGEKCETFLEPDSPDTALGNLLKGEGLKKLDSKPDWMQVWIPRLNLARWVRTTEASPSEDATLNENGIPQKLIPVLVVAKSRVNVRQDASVKSKVIAVAKKKQEYMKLDEKSGWCQIWLTDLGEKGWIYGKLVNRK